MVMPASSKVTSRRDGSVFISEDIMNTPMAAQPYNPSNLFDFICMRYGAKTDVQLAMLLGVGNPLICKMRRRVLPVSGSLLIRIHEITGISIRELKETMNDRRSKQRASKNKLVNGRAKRRDFAVHEYG